jgi:hypothetical protein
VQTCRAAPVRRFLRGSGRVVNENLLICCEDQVEPARMLYPPRWSRATDRLAQREGILNPSGGAFDTSVASSRIRSAAPSNAARGAFRRLPRHAVALTLWPHVDRWEQFIRTRGIWSDRSVVRQCSKTRSVPQPTVLTGRSGSPPDIIQRGLAEIRGLTPRRINVYERDISVYTRI